MGLFDTFKKGVEDLFIARPQEAANALIWRYPDQSIPNGAKLTVRSDESVLFFREGRFAGSLEAGTYTMDTKTIPFLGNLVFAGLTGANDYIAELFFVRKAEFIHETKQRELGTYNDLASRHVVTVQFNARYGVIVTDPCALITTMGGQTANASQTVGRFLDSRLKSLLSAIVGQLLGEQPTLGVVSNAYNEQIGQMVHEKAKDEFASQGLELTRFLGLNLTLDDESEEALKEFGRQQAKLTIEREGADIAGGYANYQLAQGQRAALEGIGEGIGSGQGPNAILGMNIGGGGGLGGGMGNRPQLGRAASLTGGRGPTPRLPTSPKVQTAATMQWMLQGSRGVEGPYSVRQVVLRAISDGLDETTAQVRGVDDPEFFGADTEDVLVREFQRRLTKGRKRLQIEKNSQEKSQFETVFKIAVDDAVLTDDELLMLVPMALSAGIGQDEDSARKIVLQRAKAYGCVYEPGEPPAPPQEAAPPPPPPPPPASEAPPPPPPPPTEISEPTFSYNDGNETLSNVTASQIAEKVAAAPDGYHVVWNEDLGDWKTATEVASISNLLPGM